MCGDANVNYKVNIAIACGGLFRRVVAALRAQRHDRVEREIADYLQHTGGPFTDSIERRISDQIVTRWPGIK